MSMTSVFRVGYHFEQGGKKSSQEYVSYINAATNDYNTLSAVMSSNGLLQGGKMVIDFIANTGPSPIYS